MEGDITNTILLMNGSGQGPLRAFLETYIGLHLTAEGPGQP